MEDRLHREMTEDEDYYLVRITSSKGQEFEGLLIEATPTAVVVDFSQWDAPAFPISDRVDLLLTGGRLEEPISIVGRVTYRGEDQLRMRYRFSLSSSDGEKLGGSFNRRGAFRVKPETFSPVTVMLENEVTGDKVNASLKDVSRTGLSVAVTMEGEKLLANAHDVNVSFRLPEDSDILEMQGIVRYRRLAGTTVRYGIEFDADGLAGFDRKQARLADYVMKRQAQMLQEIRTLFDSEAA